MDVIPDDWYVYNDPLLLRGKGVKIIRVREQLFLYMGMTCMRLEIGALLSE